MPAAFSPSTSSPLFIYSFDDFAIALASFDYTDAAIMALSERLQITKVCTFDRRDFGIFRPKHCDYLELLP